jgi:hypothetical protein
MLPPGLQRLLDEIDACERDAESLLADLDEAGVNWTPAMAGGWTIAQCLDHLARTNAFYLQQCVERVRDARTAKGESFTGLRPTRLGRWFVRSLEPPPRFKGKAPRQVAPAPTIARDELLPAYIASHDGYRALVRASADVDVNRVTMPNPFFPRMKMRMSTVLLVIPAHDRRHLWQAHQVKRALPPR